MMRRGRSYIVGFLAAIGLVASACDKAQLLAPTQSTITVSAAATVLPSNGSTSIAASVIEQAGTPVHNGTTVRFTTTLGRVEPAETQTTNGVAVTTFFAGPNSGIAEIRAVSGAATAEGDVNRVRITVGAAAVNTVTLRANPGSVGPNGGTVELVATVVGENGQALEGIAVTFNADQGSLDSSTVFTNTSGEARTILNTSQQTVVSATAGTKTSSNVTVAARPGPAITLTCLPATGTSTNCASVQANVANNSATVTFSVARATGSSTLRTATLDFGDGTSQSLGNLGGGTTTVTHTYEGPSGLANRVYTATVQATDINGESASTSVTVVVTPRPTQLNVSLTATPGTAVVGVGVTVSFTATVTPATGGADMVQRFAWSFGDGSDTETSGGTITHVYTSNGVKTATVTVTTIDGRTATATVQFIISGI